ncbi:MAG: protein phosphatase 2C domain-containing protein [Anaerolineae bacterium]|nr:protein phosphatase 2C domain-containing protein [Anaerolineae bacterium]NUQ02534.1 serine/threonine-protein phosphatase [Anaerolineae bacterium]
MNFLRRFLERSDTKKLELKPTTPIAQPEPSTAPAAESPYAPAPPSTAELHYGDGVTRPLNEEVLISFLTPRHITFGQITDTGSVRGNNQDAAVSFFASSRSSEERPDFGLFIVADGMGGHHDGEKASAIAARTVADAVLTSIYIPMLKDVYDNQTPITETLVEAIEAANVQVHSSIPDGGTTLTCVILINDLAYLAHVGDSRLYLISKGSTEQLTRDHSLVQRLIELDQLTPDEAVEHPQKHVLYRALGQNDNVEVDALTRRLPPRSRLLLCSDGLWGLVEQSDLMDIVNQAAQPLDACQKLVALANKRGGLDNITVIVIFLPD